MLSLPYQTFSPRIVLRRPNPGDASKIFRAWGSDPYVFRHLTYLPPNTLQDTQVYLEKCDHQWRNGSSFTYLIAQAQCPELPFGSINLQPDKSEVMLGYVIAQSHWGRGYASEALRICLTATMAHPHINRAWGFAHPDNIASCRVMENANLKFERIVPRFMVFPAQSAEPSDVRLYSLVRLATPPSV